MPDTKVSLIDISALSEPATKLIEAVSDAIGVAYEPTRTRRKAEAEAYATVTRTRARITSEGLLAHARRKRKNDELRQQKNRESIFNKALPLLPPAVNQEKVDPDWIVQFFNYAQDVSNEEMQLIWAQLLAGEVATPGKYSLRTLNLVRMLRQSDAQLVKKLANYVWSGTHYYHNEQTHELLKSKGLRYADLLHLQSLGLISVEEGAGVILDKGDYFELVYGEKSVEVSYNPESYVTDKIKLPSYLLTDIGRELLPLCDTEPDAEYFDAVIKDWAERGIEVQVTVTPVK